MIVIRVVEAIVVNHEQIPRLRDLRQARHRFGSHQSSGLCQRPGDSAIVGRRLEHGSELGAECHQETSIFKLYNVGFHRPPHRQVDPLCGHFPRLAFIIAVIAAGNLMIQRAAPNTISS